MEITKRVLEGLRARTVNYEQWFKRRELWLEQEEWERLGEMLEDNLSEDVVL